MRKRKVIRIVFIIIFTFLVYKIGQFSSYYWCYRTRKKFTEQTKFLVQSICERLEENDPKLKEDLKEFNKHYHINYEGYEFERLSKKYFSKKYAKHKFYFQNLNPFLTFF